MKKYIILSLFFVNFSLFSQTILFEDTNVSVYYKVESISNNFQCKNDWDKNYLEKNIQLYKIVLGLKNNSTRSIKPASVQIARIDFKTCPYLATYDYCGHNYLEGTLGNSSTGQLTSFSIRGVGIKSIKPKEFIENTTYLYVYEDITPLVSNWSFDGYWFKDDNRLISNGNSGVENKDIHYKAWLEYNDLKIKTNYQSGNCPQNKNNQNIEVPFSIVETLPRFVDCNGNKSELNKCFQNGITNHIIENFDFEVLKQTNLPAGKIKNLISFVVSNTGAITDIKIKSPSRKIESELYDVIKTIPNLIPATQKGKKVSVPYSMPLSLVIEDTKESEDESQNNKNQDILNNENSIVGNWIKTTGCPDGRKMTQTFNSDGTGFVIVQDCNKACSPYYYKMTFNWKTSGNTLTLEYLSVSPYCGVTPNPPGTFDMDYNVNSNELRIVQDRYIRK